MKEEFTMKKKLITKLGLAVLLSGMLGTGFLTNTVHADFDPDDPYIYDNSAEARHYRETHNTGWDTPYGYKLNSDREDIPMFTASEIKYNNIINGENDHYISKSAEHQIIKLDNYHHPVKVRKFKATKLVKKYYNACSIKFKKISKIKSRYNDSEDLVHHNGFFGDDENGEMTPTGIINNSARKMPNSDVNVGYPKEYALGYKKINGLWAELIATYSPSTHTLMMPNFTYICPMVTKPVYKCIKTTNTFGAPDDGTSNGIGDKNHQYAQILDAYEKGSLFHLINSKSNWRATANVQKVYGNDMVDTTSAKGTPNDFSSGTISTLHFSKYFKRVK